MGTLKPCFVRPGRIGVTLFLERQLSTEVIIKGKNPPAIEQISIDYSYTGLVTVASPEVYLALLLNQDMVKVLNQGTLYTQEGYGTICAIVNQLWA